MEVEHQIQYRCVVVAQWLKKKQQNHNSDIETIKQCDKDALRLSLYLFVYVLMLLQEGAKSVN